MSRPSLRRTVAILVVLLGGLLVVATAYVGIGLWTNSRMPLGTVVAGIDMSGMDRADAERAVRELASRAQEPMQLVTPEAEIEVVPAMEEKAAAVGSLGGSVARAAVGADAVRKTAEVVVVCTPPPTYELYSNTEK